MINLLKKVFGITKVYSHDNKVFGGEGTTYESKDGSLSLPQNTETSLQDNLDEFEEICERIGYLVALLSTDKSGDTMLQTSRGLVRKDDIEKEYLDAQTRKEELYRHLVNV